MFIRRKFRIVRKRRIARKPTLRALQKQVSAIKRQERRKAEYINLGQYNADQSIVAPYAILNLCNYNGMAPIFGTAANDQTDNKVIHQSFGMDLRVSLENSINNEENTIGFTAFLVSLRDAASQVFTPSNGTLSLTANTHYYQTAGMALLNKKIFKIHKFKRFTLTNYGSALTASAAQTQYGTDHRWYWKFSPRAVITNPSGDWSALQSALDPSKQYYVMIFTDNTSADTESPSLTANIVHTLKKVD